MMNASDSNDDMELPKFCPMKICNLCQKYVFSPDLRYIQNLRIVTRCTKIFDRGCCEDFFDEYLVTGTNDERTGNTAANLLFSFLFGIACCGALFLIGKYIKDREAEKSNFNSMRRLSRARSITSQGHENQRRVSMLSAGRQFTDMTFPLAPEAGFYSNRRRSTLVTCAAHQKLGRKLSLQPTFE